MRESSVSVITPTIRGRERLLEDCKASVAGQTVPVEHLVELDESQEGPQTVRNRLVARAETEWVLPVDDDDVLDPDCVETLLARADGADVVYPWCRTEGDNQIVWLANKLFNADTLFRVNFIPVTALVRRDTWLMLGGMRREPLEDWRLWQRAVLHGCRFRCVPEVLWTYHFEHGSNTYQR